MTRTDVRLQLPTYTPSRRKGRDDYRCFVVAWPDRPQYVTGFDVVPGERREVHHMIVFVAQPRDAATVDAWDAGDPGAGYGCYGGPSATGSTDIAARFLAGWAPGSSGADLPEGTGQLVEAGSRLIVQIHYNLESTTPRPDHSVVELKVDDSVAKRAASAPVVNPGWLISPQSFRIPAGKRVTHSWAGDPRPFLRFLSSDVDLSQGFTIHSVLLHMHRLGRRGQVAIVRASGKREVLLSISRTSTGSVTTGLQCRCGSTTATGSRSAASTGTRLGAPSRGARTRPTRCASASCTSRSSSRSDAAAEHRISSTAFPKKRVNHAGCGHKVAREDRSRRPPVTGWVLVPPQ